MNKQLELIFEKDVAYADSRVIADYFEKRHADVLRDIRKMLKDIGNERNFASVYTDAKGEKRTCYRLPFDETVTLITGYDAKLRYNIVKQWRKLIEERSALRMTSKQVRNKFTDALKFHGYKTSKDYSRTTADMKEPLGIKAKKGDMTPKELKMITAAEYLAEAMLDNEYGFYQVNPVCVNASKAISGAVEKKMKQLTA